MKTAIYQVEAERQTMQSAVKDFARTYWQEARKARKINQDGTFTMVGGTGASYQIELIPGKPGVQVSCYQISKLS
jgi:hypothetical protein